MGLIRKAIVLGGILLAMPSPPAAVMTTGLNAVPPPSTFATISAAAETYADVRGFCERRPQACVTGQYLAASLEGKLRYTSKLIYEWANPSTKSGQGQQTANPAKLRLATLSDEKPNSIEDLLKGSINDTVGN